MPEENKKQKFQPSRLWIISADGKPTISGTFATVAFVTTTLVYIASIFEKIGPVTIRNFDPTACAAYLTPVLALYFGRRRDDSKSPRENNTGSA